jgi:hypothetical protein
MPNRDSKRAAPFGRLSLLRVPVTRREFALRVLGGMGTVAVLARGGADGAAPAASAGGMDAGTAGAACKVYPQETEGPYYLDLDLLRSDITEGRAGTPLALVMQVVSATTCAPLKGVAVDVWHCDAAGVYSGYSGQLGRKDTSNAADSVAGSRSGIPPLLAVAATGSGGYQAALTVAVAV